ncbi:NADAR family protein [Gordonia iterans]
MSDHEQINRFRGDHYFLSNFFQVDFEMPVLGRVPSAEHAYQALKTDDDRTRRKILDAESPGEAKRLGRGVPVRKDWQVGGRVGAMIQVLAAKFEVPQMAERLQATGCARLVEGNEHHDNFWGDCTCGAAACEERGTNMLGELLMWTRADTGAW